MVTTFTSPVPGNAFKSDPLYMNPEEFLECIKQPGPSCSPVQRPYSIFSPRIAATVLFAAILIAVIAYTINLTTSRRMESDVTDLESVFDTLEKAIAELGKPQFSVANEDLVAKYRGRISAASTGNDIATSAIQRWNDIKESANLVIDGSFQRKKKHNELELLLSSLRVSAASYFSARDAFEHHSTSAAAVVEQYKQFISNQDSLQTRLNAVQEQVISYQKESHSLGSEAEKTLHNWTGLGVKLSDLSKSIFRAKDDIQRFRNEKEYFLKQIESHDNSVIEAANTLKELSRRKASLVEDRSRYNRQRQELLSNRDNLVIQLNTIESLGNQLSSILPGQLDGTSTFSLKQSMDHESEKIQALIEEHASVSVSAGSGEDLYDSNLRRSRLLMDRVEHELRLEAIRFIYDSLSLDESGDVLSIISVIDSNIEQAKSRISQASNRVYDCQASHDAVETELEEVSKQITSLELLQSECGYLRQTMESSLENSEVVLQSASGALEDLSAAFSATELQVAEAQQDYEATLHKQKTLDEKLQVATNEVNDVKQKLQRAKDAVSTLLKTRKDDLTMLIQHRNTLQSRFEEFQFVNASVLQSVDNIELIDQQLQIRTTEFLSMISSRNDLSSTETV
uniref:Uncharacterized protein n=1 Tax=Spongospora subterranea TaxID=70186 RepID=A0A0H5QN38_9EUKA|eukprot:CRZ02781.1 hypothetical protein [Spongospora subterranea]